MATLHIRPNHLRQSATSHRRILFSGLLTAALAILIHPFLAFLVAVAILVFHQANTSSAETQRHGATGEDRALGIPVVTPGALITLPDSYTVFNQLIVPLDRGSCEIDFLVVGPNGVFVIEVKHHRGIITGKEHDDAWIQIKPSRMGRVYASPMRNPASQVKRAIRGLKRYLALHGITIWIEGVVVLSHPDCVPDLGPLSVPVLKLPALADHLRGARATGVLKLDKTKEIIQALWEANLVPVRASRRSA